MEGLYGLFEGARYVRLMKLSSWLTLDMPRLRKRSAPPIIELGNMTCETLGELNQGVKEFLEDERKATRHNLIFVRGKKRWRNSCTTYYAAFCV